MPTASLPLSSWLGKFLSRSLDYAAVHSWQGRTGMALMCATHLKCRVEWPVWLPHVQFLWINVQIR